MKLWSKKSFDGGALEILYIDHVPFCMTKLAFYLFSCNFLSHLCLHTVHSPSSIVSGFLTLLIVGRGGPLWTSDSLSLNFFPGSFS